MPEDGPMRVEGLVEPLEEGDQILENRTDANASDGFAAERVPLDLA